MTMTDAIRYLKEKYVIPDSLAQVRTEFYTQSCDDATGEVAAKRE